MTTSAPSTTPLEHWPANAQLAFVLGDGDAILEFVLTLDGRAILGDQAYVVELIPVAERRAGLAALRAGLI